jgi:hypothetical protein
LSSEPLPFHVKSFIWKRGAFADDEVPMLKGITSHCTHCNGRELFHLYLDCDDLSNLRQMLDRIDVLRKRFRELASAKFLIVQTSPWNFSLASFPRLTWERYLDVLWFGVKIGLVHEGYAVYTMTKGYAVLRTGAKNGVVPTILYSIGDVVTCKKCFGEFVEEINGSSKPLCEISVT